tara:strand:- start:2055 stop:2540 length:486 start_codon:yes stop_codon:yes gene_type:complete
MKVVRNLLVVFGIIIITYGVMININRNKYTDMCTTVYVVKDEDHDHILDNADFMVVRNNNENIRVSDLKNEYNSSTLAGDFFKYMNRLHPSLSENIHDDLSDRQKRIVRDYRDQLNNNSLSQTQKIEIYNEFTREFISASPMYNLVSNNDNSVNRIRELRT